MKNIAYRYRTAQVAAQQLVACRSAKADCAEPAIRAASRSAARQIQP
jgi:hypothetical protein